MNDHVEKHRRKIYVNRVRVAPSAEGLPDRSRSRSRTLNRRRAAGLAVLGVAAGTAAVLGIILEQDAGSSPPAVAASCVEIYSPDAVAKRSFAFDGTISGLGAENEEMGTISATLSVAEWFRGGSDAIITLDLAAPGVAVVDSEGGARSYAIGTRLLASGEPRWGGPALADAVAWSCGFTRSYDAATAEVWRRAFTATKR